MGDAPGDDQALCDSCMTIERPWRWGTAVMTYHGVARRLVMALKHGDRQDLVIPMASWMIEKIRGRLGEIDVVVPVPIHWRRMVKRKFNQSALLSNEFAKSLEIESMPDALLRARFTKPQEGLSLAERFDLQNGSISENPRRIGSIRGQRVLLIDDVMTSGATFHAGTLALQAMGAKSVYTVALARVVKG